MICEIICIDGFLCMLHLDIVHILSAYVHVIHILSGHMRIMCTLFAVVLDIFLPNRQCRYHPYVISSTLCISYNVELSFCTLSAQTHIVHVICMLSTHVHIICLSSLPLLKDGSGPRWPWGVLQMMYGWHMCLQTTCRWCTHLQTMSRWHMSSASQISNEFSLSCRPHIICMSYAHHPHQEPQWHQ